MEEIQSHEWYSDNPTNNKKYTKVNEYEALLIEGDSTENIEYKEKLIDYDEDYENYDPYQD